MNNYNLADAIAAVLTETKRQQKLVQDGINTLNEAVRQFNGRTHLMREEVKADMHRTLEGAAQKVAENMVKHLTGANAAADRAIAAYLKAERSASWKVTVLAASLGALTIGFCALYILPNEKELAALRAEQARLTANVAALEKRGARADIQQCGSGPEKPRTCVRIDVSAPTYGNHGEYRLLATD